jgi:DNA-nicking Smr family endonuclease
MAHHRLSRRLTDAEQNLWREVIRTVTPIRCPAASPASDLQSVSSAPPPISGRPATYLPQPASPGAPKRAAFGPVEIDAPEGTDRRTAQRLRRGRMTIDARLDLHGFTVAQAQARLLEFLRTVQAHGGRCVLVVTGKGGRNGAVGKLKAALPEWINDPLVRPLVLSAARARPRDGGDGAVYILLRKARGHADRLGGESQT